MDMPSLTSAAAATAVLGTGVVYGTDMFCAMVLRPALASIDDDTLVTVTGRIHRYGDRRMPVPGALGIVGAIVSTIAATAAAHTVQVVAAAVGLAALLGWLVLYLRISAPINRQLTTAADSGRTLSNGRALQEAKWDSVMTTRAALQGLAMAASCVVLLT